MPRQQETAEHNLQHLAQVLAFIDEAIDQGGSCLLQSSSDLSPAAEIATAYFVVKYEES